MLNRWGLTFATGLLSGSFACTGTVSDVSTARQALPPAAAGAGSSYAEATGGTSALLGGGVEDGTGAGEATQEPRDEPALPDELSGERDQPELPPIEFCDAPTKVFVASCGNGSCHSNPNVVIGDFAVDAQRAYNFVDRVAVRNAGCGKIIDSQDYSKSLILTKVRGDFEVPKCGERMPIGSFVITTEQIDCIASWLQQFQL
ncbi:MAG: hypothetical protein RL033_2121 [Pseudomonadota bacterium]|jgi:hypothetical protein